MTLSKIVDWLKMNTAKQINLSRNTPGMPVWQRNFYEHVIRHKKDLNRIRHYIMNNPFHWDDDENNSSNFMKND